MRTKQIAFQARHICTIGRNWKLVYYIGVLIMIIGDLQHLEAASIGKNQTGDEQFLTRRVIFQNFFVEVGIQISCYGSCDENIEGAPVQAKDPTCEGNVIRLNCAKPYVIKIQSASCGQLEAGKDLCKLRNTFGQLNKGRRDSTVTVANMCETKTQCEMVVEKPQFHEECVGEYNYLDVKFLCVLAPTTTMKTTTTEATTTSPVTTPTTTQATTNIIRTTLKAILSTSKKEATSRNLTTLFPIVPQSGRTKNIEKRSLSWFLSAFALISDGKFVKANITHMTLTILLSVFIGFIISLCMILNHCRRKRGLYSKSEEDDNESSITPTDEDSCSSKCYLLDEQELQVLNNQQLYCAGSNNSSSLPHGNGIDTIPRRSLLRMKTNSCYSDTIEPDSDFPEPPQEFLTDISSSDQRQSLISGTEEDSSTISNSRYLQSDQSTESLAVKCHRADHVSTGHSCYRDIPTVNNKAMILFNNELVSMTTKRQHEQRLCAMHAAKLKMRDSPDCYPVDDRPAQVYENPRQSIIKIEEANNVMLNNNNNNNKIIRNGYHTITNDGTNDKHISFGPIVDSDGLVVNMDVNEQIQDRGKLKVIPAPTIRRSCLRQSSLTKEDKTKARPKSLHELSNGPTACPCHDHHHGYGSKPNQLNRFKNNPSDITKKPCQCHTKGPTGLGEPYGSRRSTLKRTKTLPTSSEKTWKPPIRKAESLCCEHTNNIDMKTEREIDNSRPAIPGSSLPRRQNSIPRDRNRKLMSPVKHTGHVSREQPLNITPKDSPANSLNRVKIKTFPLEHKNKWIQRVDGSSDEEAAISPTSITESPTLAHSLNRKPLLMNGSSKKASNIPPVVKTKSRIPPPVRPKVGKVQIQLRQSKDADEHVSATSL